MEIKTNTQLGHIPVQPDPFKRSPNFAHLPGRDINNKLVDTTERSMGALRPSEQHDKFEVKGTHVNFQV
ncbi:MAG: hypothetical protein HS115_04590 [Spirochaetales bacterium]|nr:hypothetical protein [Spirochaetales bacterium]